MPKTKAIVAAAMASKRGKRMGKTGADETAKEKNIREPSPDPAPAPKRRGRPPKAPAAKAQTIPDPPATDKTPATPAKAHTPGPPAAAKTPTTRAKAHTPDPPTADKPQDPADKVRKNSAKAKAKGKAGKTAGAKDGAGEAKDGAAGSVAAKGAEKKGTGTGGEVQEPKRPLNSYLLWLAENRERVQGEMGSKKGPGSKRILSVAGKEWRGMSDAEKAPWQKKARDAKERYDEELDAFNDAQPSD